MYLKASILVAVVTIAAVTVIVGQPSNADKGMLAARSNQRVGAAVIGKDRLVSIKIVRHDPETEWTEKTFYGQDGSVSNLDLELGEAVENQVIVLEPSAADARAFKIEQQFETSVAIGDEGPHLDLVNWKHYTSAWKEIESQGDNRFLTSKIPEGDNTRFPAVTWQEIHRVALKEGGRRWANLARQCKNLVDGPCYVGVSRISFRISANDNGVWREIHMINVSIPLGC